MYNDSQMPQTGRHPSLDYQSEPVYQQRQTTAVEVLSNQFGSQQYDVSSVSQPSTIPSSYQSASVHHQGAYGPSADLGQTALTPGYSSSDLAISQGSAAGLAQPQAPQDPFAPYHHLRRQVNTLIVQGRIAEARPSLLAMSNILVDGVERLRERNHNSPEHASPQENSVTDQFHSELNHDDTTRPGADEREKYEARVKYEARLTFWRNLHYSWVAFLQRQLNDTQTMLSSDRPAGRVRSANLLAKDALEQLGDDVVRIANGLERYGLVDYEIGFFENEIIPSELFFRAVLFFLPLMMVADDE